MAPYKTNGSVSALSPPRGYRVLFFISKNVVVRAAVCADASVKTWLWPQKSLTRHSARQRFLLSLFCRGYIYTIAGRYWYTGDGRKLETLIMSREASLPVRKAVFPASRSTLSSHEVTFREWF